MSEWIMASFNSPAHNRKDYHLQSKDSVCPLCLSYEDHITLKCGHTFCQKCVRQRMDANCIKCPNCSAHQEFADGTLTMDNFLMSHVYDLVSNTTSQHHSPPIFQPETGGRQPRIYCQSCTEQLIASKFCTQCKEYLCNNCTLAHQRVSLTKDHSIVNTDISANFRTSLRYCAKHQTQKLQYYCKTCREVICEDCMEHMHHQITLLQDTVQDIQQLLPVIVSDLRIKRDQIDTIISKVDKVISDKDQRAQQVTSTIQSCIQQHIVTLQELEKDFIGQVEKIRKIKHDILVEQREQLVDTKRLLNDTVSATVNAYSAQDNIDLLTIRNRLQNQLAEMQENMAIVDQIQDDDNIGFTHQSESLRKAMVQLGTVTSSCSPLHTTASGQGIVCAILRDRARLYLTLRNYSNQKLLHSNDQIDVTVQDPAKKSVPVESLGYTHGIHQRSYIPTVLGPHKISVKVRGRHILGSPFTSTVRRRRNYSNIGTSHKIVGHSGEADGQLCRPWGICADSKGHIIVADRSNHRIQIFNPDGSFKMKFGSCGGNPGQFDKPAGVALNSYNQIVVADKDNHRVQVFEFDGTFVKSFGSKGSMDGQLHYPWDVACNHEDCVLVSDTRNHRIQLFSPNGQFLNKFDFHGPPHARMIPSQPRGVCFTESGDMFVTDFDKHRLMLIRSNFQTIHIVGNEGQGDAQFYRPQGVTVDVEGNILVSEGRNHRIQIFRPNGSFLTKFGTHGTGPNQLDCPQGLCVTPDGYIVVVDFNNNRILFF